MTYNEETGIDLAFSLKVKTLLDAKLCNYYPNGENFTMVVEDIPGYLSRVRGDMRSAGAKVTMLIPLDGNTSSGTIEYDYDSFDGSGYIPKYYTFIGGLSDVNFVEASNLHDISSPLNHAPVDVEDRGKLLIIGQDGQIAFTNIIDGGVS